MELGLKEKNAIVTGGSRGVGRAIALALAKEGANVALTYRSHREKAQEVVESIKSFGRKAFAYQVNLADTNEAAESVHKAIRDFGGVDVLINNAGIWPKCYVKDMDLTEWEETLDVNLTSVFLTCQAFTNYCLEQNRKGKILNITSQAAFYGSTTGHAHYAASKAGMVGFTISLAREVAKSGINVNNLALGIVETDMIRDSLEKRKDYYLNRIPLGRAAAPKEIAGIAIFLVSEKANYLTGATIDATGGMLMR
ncbi:3-oxoacyl-[acyl-carrier protein] reductase [Scopulibacillus daqui]|uniref:3-oxoacyl-[acyl-carrier protein] reductase n=1 Tax=Scopulibacillus daqui TaxID=1469162 RepID=A0ABS2Q0X3_9BACL|nr:3-oxoacyl-ACP reductase family protein [Scopulibacillus daqui]MBM7645942.1 3-oxoacyl-[acyl-carrier protein] reductase [Scopulibacillus daqui]